MADSVDILKDNDNDMLWVNGDMVIGPSDGQHIQDILSANPGDCRMYPLCGCSANKLINGTITQAWLSKAKQQLQQDGFKNVSIKVTGSNISVDANR